MNNGIMTEKRQVCVWRDPETLKYYPASIARFTNGDGELRVYSFGEAMKNAYLIAEAGFIALAKNLFRKKRALARLLFFFAENASPITGR